MAFLVAFSTVVFYLLSTLKLILLRVGMILYKIITDGTSEKIEKKIRTASEMTNCWCELKDFHVVGFCTRCVKQTRLSHHCDDCGGHSRWNIVKHIVKEGGTDNICTRCFHLTRYAHHCDFCKESNSRVRSNGIVSIQWTIQRKIVHLFRWVCEFHRRISGNLMNPCLS